MLKFQISTLLLFINVFLFCQSNNIHGKITDYYSNEPICGVQITNSYSDTIIYSNRKGKFRFGFHTNHNDTLIFIHPAFHNTTRVVSESYNYISQKVKLIPDSVTLDTIYIHGYQNQKLIGGIIFDKNKRVPIPAARIRIDDKIISYSNIDGVFSVVVPDTLHIFNVFHPDYTTEIITIRKNRKNKKNLEIGVKKKLYKKDDYPWLDFKNYFGIAVNELLAGSFSLRFERYFNSNYAIGINSSAYLLGYGINRHVSYSQFTGIKIAPFFRLYTKRTVKDGGYLEAKLITGYFDFNKLYYQTNKSYSGVFVKEDFGSFGIGIGGGYWSFVPGSNRVIFSLYAGCQYFPLNAPKSIWHDHYGDVYRKNSGWYLYGPGSIIEMKLIFGFIF